MMTARVLLLILHITSAALLVGVNTGLVRSLKRTLELSREAFLLAAEDGVKRARVANGASFATLLTGLSLIFLAGGFKQVTPNFHMALGVLTLFIAVSAAVTSPSLGRLLRIAERDSSDLSAARPLIKKVAMSQGVLHLLWFVSLSLMFLRDMGS